MQQLGDERLDGFQQLLLAGAVGGANAGELRRRIAQHHVCGAAKGIEDLLGDLGRGQVGAQHRNVRLPEGLVEPGEVHPHDAPVATHGAGGHLEPAARPAAEVHHVLPAPQQAVALLDLSELVGRPRAEALALGALMPAVLALVACHGRGRAGT